MICIFATILLTIASLQLTAQEGEFNYYYPQNQLFKQLGVKELDIVTTYDSLNKHVQTMLFDNLGRLTSVKNDHDTRIKNFTYKQANDTLIKISYYAATENFAADTFMLELFVYNKNGLIMNYYNFNDSAYKEYRYGSNCVNGNTLSNLSATFYNEAFYYNDKGQCIYKHYSINKWTEVPFKVTKKLPFETLVFKQTYEYHYDKAGNMTTKTGISGDEIFGDVDSFFYKTNEIARKTTHLNKYYFSRRNFIETNYTTSIENGLKVVTIEEAASYKYLNNPLDKIEPTFKKHKYFYNERGLLIRIEVIWEDMMIINEYSYHL